MAIWSSSDRSLKTYRKKRDFASTPEPRGGEAKPERKKRLLCVQKHLASHLHYDFRLEHRGVLLSWAVPKGPSLNPRDKRLAMRVEDHPLEYGSFEGVIPSGYGAGLVMLWDRGSWTPENGDVDAALAKGELKFSLSGKKLKGSWVLVRTGGAESRNWLLIKHRDEWAAETDLATESPLSVKSSKDFAGILEQHAPKSWRSGKATPEETETMTKLLARAEELQSEQNPAPRKSKRPAARPAKRPA